jgi:predicted transcriptional regulator
MARVGPGDSPGRFHLNLIPTFSFGQAGRLSLRRQCPLRISTWDGQTGHGNSFDTANTCLYTNLVKVNFRPETESRLQELAAKTGRAPDDLVEDALAGYLQELSQVREMLDSRYDDLKTGRVKPVDGEESFARLRRKSEDRRTSRS